MADEKQFRIGRYRLKRLGTKWYIYWYDASQGKTRRRSTGETDFRVAQQRLAEFSVLNEQVRDRKPADMPVSTVLVRYYEMHAKGLRSEETTRYALRKWADFFSGCSVADLTPAKQQQFVAALKAKKYKNDYINRILTAGRAALNRSFQNQEIESVPFIKLLPSGQPRERILTMQESSALFDNAREPHLMMYLMIAFNTLARPEAILDLTPFQVDFDARLISLNPEGREQTKKHRPTLPITSTLLPWLRQRDASYYVHWHGRKIKSLKTAWRNLRDRAGLSHDVVPYTIRHTMATELRKRGVPPWEVSGFLGHRTERTTERYAKYAPDYLGHAVDAIDGYFEELQGVTDIELVKTLRAVK